LSNSRYADLGEGLVVYPVEGIGAGVLLLAAAISRFINDRSHFAPGFPVYLAAAFAIAGLVLTFKAAPIKLSLATSPSTPTAQRAFDDFFFWGLYLRGTADMLAFVSAVWALAETRRREGN
jgi:hypothetical protein